MTTKHTPLPWKATKYKGEKEPRYLIEECSQRAIVAEIPTCCGWEQGNAEYIVRACNEFPTLLKENEKMKAILLTLSKTDFRPSVRRSIAMTLKNIIKAKGGEK